MEIVDYILFISTAGLWGITNVLLKNNSKGIKDIREQDSKVKQIAEELKYLITNWRYFVTFGVNQLGSIFYFYALQRKTSVLSVAVIMTNSLTLLFTSMTSIILEKKSISRRTFLGAVLISLGSSLICIASEK